MSWACIIKQLEVLEQISGHKVQLKSKSHKEKNVREHNISASTTNCTWLLKQQVVPKSSVPPTQHILQKSGANSAWTQCDGVLYKIIPGFHHGRSLSRTFSPLTFSITEPSQLHSSSAIGLSHYAPLMDIQIQYVSNLLSPHNYPSCETNRVKNVREIYENVHEIILHSHKWVAWAPRNYTKMDYLDSFLIAYDSKHVLEALQDTCRKPLSCKLKTTFTCYYVPRWKTLVQNKGCRFQRHSMEW